jgi:hypothetical protein
MTENANLKRRIRARAAKTGESYSAARRHLLGADETASRPVLIATAQCVLAPDPRSRDQLREWDAGPSRDARRGGGGRIAGAPPGGSAVRSP